MPNRHSTLTSLFSDVADAIRSKTGGTAELVADNFDTAIEGIQTQKPEQSKTATPTTSQQTITPDSGYALSSVVVNAMPTGSIAVNTPSINTSTGVVTASTTLSTAGYVGSNPSSKTLSLTTQAAKTVTPSTSSQTAVSAGVYTTGAVTVAAIPNQQAGGAKYATTSAQTLVTAPKYITSNITLGALSQTNLSAANIKSGTTVSVSNGSSNVFSVTGTYKEIDTVSSVPSTKSTEIIYNTSDESYYAWTLGGRFVCVGGDGAYYSKDGTNWIAMSGLSANCKAVTYGNGRFVCVGFEGASYYSTNGTSWTAMSGLNASYDYYAVAYGNGRFVCVGNEGASYYSTNGTSWTAMTGLETAMTTFRGVTYGNGRFVCVGHAMSAPVLMPSKTYYSTDGTTWTAMTGLSTGELFGVSYGNDRFICVGSSSELTARGITYYSTNGTSWTSMETLSSLSSVSCIAYGNDRFVCGGWENGGCTCYYSTNGTSWTASSCTATLDGITYGGGNFVYVGSFGGSGYSADGTSWTAMTGLNPSKTYNSVAFGAGM